MNNTAIGAARGNRPPLNTELAASTRTLILPCCEKKRPEASTAFDLYQGTGYLSIVKKYDREQLDRAFKLYFMSAKYGLINASDWIEPYDLKLSDELVESFGKDQSLQDKALQQIQTMNFDTTLYLMVPKLYQRAFAALAGNAINSFKEIVPATGGILSQRGQLKRLLVKEVEDAELRFQRKCST